MCQCGCRGWCSVWTVLSFLRWSLTAAAKGMYPDTDMFGQPWPADSPRAKLTGELNFPMAVLQIRGDWAEFAHSLGFATWSSVLYPCMFCHAEATNWHDLQGVSLLHSPWREVTPEEYNVSCGLCEQVRVITPEQHRRIRVSLAAHKGRDGPRGKCLVCDLPDLGLLKWDRLEPSGSVPDIYAFDSLPASSFPLQVTLWRRSAETTVRHRCPLFAIPGVTLLTVKVDALHTVHLGVAQVYCMHCIWELICADLYSLGGRETDKFQNTVLRMRASLRDYYKRLPAGVRKETTEVQEFSVQLLGSRDHRQFNTKAMETKGLVGWVVELLREHVGRLGAAHAPLLQAGEQLLAWFRIVKESPREMGPAHLQQMFQAGILHLASAKNGGVPMVPKHHLFIHMLRRSVVDGNPRTYATFRDEGANRVLAAVARTAYAAVWEQRIFSNFNRLELSL